MIEVVDEVSKSCVIKLSRGSKTWEKHMLAFVDDKRHYVNGNNKQTSKSILTVMDISVSSWNKILHFVGGSLETTKCPWYLIKWNFDYNDSPRMQETKEELSITMYDGSKIKSTQLQPNQATTYLGVTSQVDENQSTQTTILKKKANKINRNLNCCHMPHYYGHIHQLCSINPKLTYPLVASLINNKQLKSIHNLIHSSVILIKGFNRNWPEGLQYGNQRVEQRLRKIQLVHKLLLHPTYKILMQGIIK